MIAYYCDRCGKEIVDGTIYRVAITAESVNILCTADTLATAGRTAGRLESKNA